MKKIAWAITLFALLLHVAINIGRAHAQQQQPSPEAINGVFQAVDMQHMRASREYANCMGDVADLKARLERAEKELATLKPPKETEKPK